MASATSDRFSNETESVKARGGVTVYVNRPGYAGRNDGRTVGHASENVSKEFIDGFDFQISNEGTLEDLKEKARVLWPQLKKLAMSRAK
jgi:hypothetical protein